MLRNCLMFFAALMTTVQVSAQCGVYFKDSNRQILSNSFAYWQFEDFDNDGLKDIFAYSPTSSSGYQIYFYKRLSANSFDTTAKITTLTDAISELSVFGDVNNDGKKDLIIVHPTNPPILTTYLNDGTGRFLTNTPAVNINNGEYPQTAGDLNNDGKADVITATGSGSTTKLYYRLAQPDNSFGAAQLLANLSANLSHSSYTSSPHIIVEDLNNDGTKDIAFVTFNTSNNPVYTLNILNNTGNATFTQTLSTSFSMTTNKLTTVDLNGDGKKDFISSVFQDPANPSVNKIKIAANNGNNSFTSSEIVVPAGFSDYSYFVNGASTGDFDGDGKTDIMLPALKKHLLLKNQGNLTFAPQEYKGYLRVDSTEPIDGDAKTDLVTVERSFIEPGLRLTTPNAYYFLYNVVRFRQDACAPSGQTSTVDFDGDGYTDRAFWNPSTGVWRYYTDDTQNNQVNFQWGSGALGDVPVPNDYDGDGRTDYAVFRKSDGNWWIFRSSDQQTFTLKFGINEDKPVPADYDGDGKADIAVYRPSEGNWYVWSSQTNQPYALHFGLAGDKPVPTDYDGDGKADIAVYRPSEGVWYRLNSSDNSFFAVQFGIADDKPVPADYDGDGKANIAVFRNGTWYVLKNNYSTSVFYWGSANDIPFFGSSYESAAFVYRRTTSSIYLLRWSADFGGDYTQYSTGSSFNETVVSSTLPPE